MNKNFALSLLLITNCCSSLQASKTSAQPTQADVKKTLREQLEKEIKALEGLLDNLMKDYGPLYDTQQDASWSLHLDPKDYEYRDSLGKQLTKARKAYADLNEQSESTKK